MGDSGPIIIEHRHGKAAFRRGAVQALTYGEHGGGIYLRVAVAGMLSPWELGWHASDRDQRNEAAKVLIADMEGESNG